MSAKPLYFFTSRTNRGHRMPIPVEVQLEEKSMQIPFCGCHIWTGSLTPRGYGKLSFDNATLLAHRVSWEVSNNTRVPDGMYVCHRCDVPSCINPDHLFVGTARQNSADMVSKGRSCRGAKQSRSKLYDHSVRHIRRTDIGTKYLSEMYEVSITTIKHIRSGKGWQHVKEV
jgi:hypothetical protein